METFTHEGPPMRARGLAQALAERAEAVCRHYLSGGRKEGRYWTAGNVAGAKGRSLYVRLAPPGAVGYWRDAATGEHGDLLELLRLQRGDAGTGPAMAEARRFLGLATARSAAAPAPCERLGDRAEAARRLWRLCRPVEGTPADAYLRARGIVVGREPTLGFHPTLYYRDAAGAFSTFPALIARATRIDGAFAGLQRTYLDPAQPAKAPVPDARKAMGRIFGAAVWLGAAEGSTSPSPRASRARSRSSPRSPRFAPPRRSPPPGSAPSPHRRESSACSSPATTTPRAGTPPSGSLRAAAARGLDAAVLVPERGDFNDDLIACGAQALGARLAAACADLATTPPDRTAVTFTRRRPGRERPGVGDRTPGHAIQRPRHHPIRTEGEARGGTGEEHRGREAGAPPPRRPHQAQAPGAAESTTHRLPASADASPASVHDDARGRLDAGMPAVDQRRHVDDPHPPHPQKMREDALARHWRHPIPGGRGVQSRTIGEAVTGHGLAPCVEGEVVMAGVRPHAEPVSPVPVAPCP